MKSSWKKKAYITWFQLFLNWISNDFGNRWFRGIIFTWCVGTIGFLVSIFFSDSNLSWGFSLSGIGYVFDAYDEYYWQMFNPVGGLNFVEDSQHPLISGFINLLTRILVIYGVYQTATAFRKYGKL